MLAESLCFTNRTVYPYHSLCKKTNGPSTWLVCMGTYFVVITVFLNVNTRKFCGFAKGKGFIIFLLEQSWMCTTLPYGQGLFNRERYFSMALLWLLESFTSLLFLRLATLNCSIPLFLVSCTGLQQPFSRRRALPCNYAGLTGKVGDGSALLHSGKTAVVSGWWNIFHW